MGNEEPSAKEKTSEPVYVIAIAIILAGLLVSGTLYVVSGNIGAAIGKISISSGSAGAAQLTQPSQPTQAAQPQQQAAAGDFSFVKDDPGIGPKDAKAVVVEFSDFQCPYCGIAYGREYGGAQYTAQRGSETSFIKDYAKTGKARFVYHSVAFLGQESSDAANAAYCAREIGGDEGFFKMHDKLFEKQSGENQGTFSKDNLKKFGAEAGFSTSTFTDCVDSGKYLSLVAKNTQDAQAVGVTGTPNYALNNRLMQAGIIPYSSITSAVDAALKG